MHGPLQPSVAQSVTGYGPLQEGHGLEQAGSLQQRQSLFEEGDS